MTPDPRVTWISGTTKDRTPTHGYEPTREAAMAAFAKSLAAGVGIKIARVRIHVGGSVDSQRRGQCAGSIQEARMENPSARVHYAVSGPDLDTAEGLAKGLSHIAKDFLTVGKLPAPDTSGFPTYFLLYHAIETALKAYLASTGMTNRELQSLGHDIKAIAAEAEQRGFTLHADEKMVLNAFECDDLDPSIAMRYFYFGSPSCPTVENLTCVAEAIVNRA
jgi:hypothetical protein